jgi:hypothetical protein
MACLIYTWRRLFREASPPGFARVEVADGNGLVAPLPMASSAGSSGLMEIALPGGGARVRVEAKVDERSLRRVLSCVNDDHAIGGCSRVAWPAATQTCARAWTVWLCWLHRC